ncbi:hypothetical protein M9H77_10975 [Catharanthus roseus]|uniref:Uncharacterized protein n=1 Tax=Catharanthus roseus TaxID=4058 RepID=A0ACC0BDA1_CATRO|nr:hypothetical protein M9H77_10975 [Catharanthus roseus]
MEFMNNNASAQGTSSTETEEKTWNLIHKSPVQPKIRIHALFSCNFLKEVWRHLPKGHKWRQLLSLSFKDLIHSISVEHSIEELVIFGTTTWLIWYARNKLKHKGTTFFEATITLQALNMTEEYSALPPNYGTLKINTDVAFLKDKIGIGVIIRNHMGIPLLAKAIPQHGCFSMEFCETKKEKKKKVAVV